jgi:queuine tRNA-ribosyltransferase
MNRCLTVKKKDHQLLFGIIQGGLFLEHRKSSVASLIDLGLPGYAIGGLSVGESKAAMYEIVYQTAAILPEDKPRYLMGVGSPEDLVECVAGGIDMFDCVMPTRVARNGALYKRTGRENITVTKYKSSDRPFDENCDCYTCARFSAGYINHLFKSREYLAYRLASIHNLHFIHTLMYEMQIAIKSGFFSQYAETFRSEYNLPDIKRK